MEEIPKAYMVNSYSTVALNLCTYETKKTEFIPPKHIEDSVTG